MDLDPQLPDRRARATVQLVEKPPVKPDPEVPAAGDLDKRRLLGVAQRDPPQRPRPLSRVPGGDDPELKQPVVRLSPVEGLDPAEDLADVPGEDACDPALEKRAPSTSMAAFARCAVRLLAPVYRYAARPMRSFIPRSACSIMLASNPAPAITAKCSPFTDPVSSRRRSPCRPTRTASVRSAGMCRFAARRLAVPAGRMARTARVPATASTQRCTIPSPPQTKMTSAPCASARRACRGALRLLRTSYQSGSANPSPASTSRSSANPPPRLLPECATTATVDMA